MAEDGGSNGGLLSRETAQRMADHDLIVETAVTVSYLTKSLEGCQKAHSGSESKLWEAVGALRDTVNQHKGGIAALKWAVGLPSLLLAVVAILQMLR